MLGKDGRRRSPIYPDMAWDWTGWGVGGVQTCASCRKCNAAGDRRFDMEASWCDGSVGEHRPAALERSRSSASAAKGAAAQTACRGRDERLPVRHIAVRPPPIPGNHWWTPLYLFGYTHLHEHREGTPPQSWPNAGRTRTRRRHVAASDRRIRVRTKESQPEDTVSHGASCRP